MTYTKAKSVITKGVISKNTDLLILEKATIRDISIAYNTARDEIAKELKARYDQLVGNIANMTPGQIEMAQIKLLRDAQLYENLETRIGQLGGKLDKINSAAILEASGISNEYVQRELESLSFFTNIDPANFARINTLQAELTVNKVNQGTVFVTAAQQAEILPQIQQQIRMGILKGEGIEKITARIVSKTGLTLEGVSRFKVLEDRARLNARWGIIESANAASNVQYSAFNKRCEDAKIETRIKKQVIAQIDDRTTITCISANGQIQEVDKPFDTDQGQLDYPPFHCSCRTTTAAWHELFEAFGKSTAEMQKEAQNELKKRQTVQANKNAARKQSKQTIAKQQAQTKAVTKAVSQTAKTAPGSFDVPTAEMKSSMNAMSTNESQKIMEMPSNAARQKAITQSNNERISMQKIAQNHVAQVQKSGKIPKDLLAYDKEVFSKGTMNLGEAADLIRKADLPGNVDIIGGLARRGNTQHDIDLIIRAKNAKFADIESKLKPLYEEFRKRGLSLDSYIEHSTGVTMGDPNTWVKGTEKYLDLLTKNHKEWTFRVAKYQDDIIAFGKKIKFIPGQEDLFSVVYEPKPAIKPPPKPVQKSEMVGNLYADDAANLATMKESGTVTQAEYNAAVKAAEDKVIAKANLFRLEKIPETQYKRQAINLQMSNNADAIAKRKIIQARIKAEVTGKEKLKLLQEYLLKDLPSKADFAAGMGGTYDGYALQVNKLFPKTKVPTQLKGIENYSVINKRFVGDWNNQSEYDDFFKWVLNNIDEKVLKKAGSVKEIEIGYAGTDSRAFYNNLGKKIYADTNDRAGTFIHEFGHHLQEQQGQVKQTMKAFFTDRVGTEKLSRIYPRLADNLEMGYKDKFFNHYCGKVYKDAYGGTERAMEILSMGLQEMQFQPIVLLMQDEEYFRLVLAAMMGLI